MEKEKDKEEERSSRSRMTRRGAAGRVMIGKTSRIIRKRNNKRRVVRSSRKRRSRAPGTMNYRRLKRAVCRE